MKRGVVSRLSRTFGGDLWTHRWALTLSSLLEIVAAGAAILTPWPLKLLIDSVIAHKPLPRLLAALDPGLPAEGLALALAAAYVLVTAIGAEEHARERFGTTNARSLEAGMHEIRLEVGMERSLNVAKGCAVALVIGGGTLLVLRGRLTVGVLTLFPSYIANLLKPVEKIND